MKKNMNDIVARTMASFRTRWNDGKQINIVYEHDKYFVKVTDSDHWVHGRLDGQEWQPEELTQLANLFLECADITRVAIVHKKSVGQSGRVSVVEAKT